MSIYEEIMDQNKTWQYQDINVISEGNHLTIGNSTFRRVFDLSTGLPRTVSLNANHVELAGANKSSGDFSLIGINTPGFPVDAITAFAVTGIEFAVIPASNFDAEHAEITIDIYDNAQRLQFRRMYYVYPGLPFISSRTYVTVSTTPRIYWHRRDDGSFNGNMPEAGLESVAESLQMADGMEIYQAASFSGRTDITNDIVQSFCPAEPRFNGNLAFAANADGNGFFLLQEAPPSKERRDFEKYDFRLDGQTLLSCCWGISPEELIPGCELKSYRHTIGFFSGGEDYALASLKNYLKTRFPLDPAKHCSVMVNPWGSGRFREFVNEEFLHEEFKAAGELGATHYQIDDGWQAGGWLRDLELNNKVGDRAYWSINTKLFPNGFAPLLHTAQEHHIEPALWLAPSANRHYCDWQDFAAMIMELYREYGFKFFKIDYVRTKTKDSEDNLEKMLAQVRTESKGEVYFNLDTTSGMRPGYFMFLEYGNIFLENRYACHNWGLGYHPESVLHNLWTLSHYMRPQSLQIEITDPGIINYDFYSNKGTTPPDVYSPEYWAAIAMFANPLLWFAPSQLKQEYRNIFRKVIALHLKYRDEIFAGEIFPVGNEPGQGRMTGFQCHNAKTGNGMLILYCEKNATPIDIITLRLLDDKASYQYQQLTLDSETITATETGRQFHAELPGTGTWQMFRYHKV